MFAYAVYDRCTMNRQSGTFGILCPCTISSLHILKPVEKNDSRRLHHTISIFCRVPRSPEFNAGSSLAGVCARVALPCLLRLFFLLLEVKKKTAGKNSRPFQEEASAAVIQRSYIRPTYRPSSRRTKSHSLLACRGSIPSRCPALGRNHTGSRDLIVQSTRGSSRPTVLR